MSQVSPMTPKVGLRRPPARGPVDAAPAPMTGLGETITAAIERRRERLPRPAAQLAGAALAAAHTSCWGRMTRLSARPERHVRKQVLGEKVLGLEELAEWALSGEVGARAARAILEVLARAIGYELRPVSSRALRIHEAKARAAEAATGLQAGLDRDLADGELQPHEVALRLEDVRRTRDALDVVEASMLAPAGPVARLPLVAGVRA